MLDYTEKIEHLYDIAQAQKQWQIWNPRTTGMPLRSKEGVPGEIFEKRLELAAAENEQRRGVLFVGPIRQVWQAVSYFLHTI